ncbi:Protein ALP1-like [Merluccius polli]|uniref:Protein ALP1-like n=1 Tax=Merluccius polli TaxID=89951 RepID=A0AA47MCE1_MERPO|nr:Protein ALP1-like [Merluccius polli]
MQAICDAKGKFLDIYVGYPGSVHDTRVMKNNVFYLTARNPPPGYVMVVGTPASRPPLCLLTPFKEPVIGRVRQLFNYRQSKARSIIERAFGMMKTRWRSTLFRAIEVKPTFAPQVIASCAFLHNVCLDNGNTLDPDEDITRDDLDPHPPQEQMGLNETPGNHIRDTLAAHVSM